jgi:hypothetical protein
MTLAQALKSAEKRGEPAIAFDDSAGLNYSAYRDFDPLFPHAVRIEVRQGTEMEANRTLRTYGRLGDRTTKAHLRRLGLHGLCWY